MPVNEFEKEFISEAGEHLEKVEKELLLLEKYPDNPDSLSKLFRSVHSIKGGAGFMGYKQFSSLAHVMETLLQMMREGEIRPESEVIDALLSGNDVLKNMLRTPNLPVSRKFHNTHNKISGLITLSRVEDMQDKPEKLIIIKDLSGNKFEFSVSESKLKKIPPDCPNLFFINCELHELQKKGLSPPLFYKSLMDRGCIIDMSIETDAENFMQPVYKIPLICNIFYATGINYEKIDIIPGIEKHLVTRLANNSKYLSSIRDESVIDLAPEKEITPEKEEIPMPELEPEPDISKDIQEHTDTVRIRIDILDKMMKLAGELVLVRNNLLAVTKSFHEFQGISKQLNIVTTEIQETVMQTRMQPIGNLFSKLPRLVRDLSAKLKRKIELRITGNEVELDKNILESLTDPLFHIIRNSCDHGIEPPEIRIKNGKPVSGQILIMAFHEAGQINIRISDDGMGIDPDIIRKKALKAGIKSDQELSIMNNKDILNLIFISGFSTADHISYVSGRGVGMDVVKSGVDSLGGSLDIESGVGTGTTLSLRLPLTLAIIPCLIIGSKGCRYAIPQVNLVSLVCLFNKDIYTKIEYAASRELFRLRDNLLPLVRLNEVLNRPEPFTDAVQAEIMNTYYHLAQEAVKTAKFINEELNFVVVKIGNKQYGLMADQIIGVEEMVVNPIHPAFRSLNIYSGTTILGDGSVAFILDIEGIAGHAGVKFNTDKDEKNETAGRKDLNERTFLLFKSGIHEQFAVPLQMIQRIEPVDSELIEKAGIREFISINSIPVLILRLDKYLDVSPCIENKEMLLILPKNVRGKFGILISEVTGTQELNLNTETDNYTEPGLLGTSVIKDRMTLFIDILELIKLAEPEWIKSLNYNKNKQE